MLSNIVTRVYRNKELFRASIVITVFLLLSLLARHVSRSRSRANAYILGARDLPSLPFKWPNGQGTEKFFDGRRAARRWRKQYGPLYSIWSGFRREVVLTTPQHVQIFFRDSHNHIKATDNNSGWLFGELLGSCVGLVSQKEWQRVRKPFEPHFTRSASLDMTGLFLSEARDFVAHLSISRGGEDKTMRINTTNDLKYCPFFMVASIFFGGLTPKQRGQLNALGPPREDLFKETFRGGINRYKLGKVLPWSSMGRLRKFQQRWESFAREAFEESVQKDRGAIVPLWEAMEKGDMSMKQLLQTLDESLFANLDVTAHAVSWNVIDVAQHQDLQQQLLLEIRSHSSPAQYEAYLAYLAREDTLLAACILESSRLHPILPFSNPEAASIDKVIDGYFIPKNTDVIVDAYAINVENPYWKDPLRFDPHRHLGQRERRYNMWRFGFGPRQCLGKNAADIILRVIVAEMVGRYRLDLVGGEVELQADSWIGLPDGVVEMTLSE